MGIPNDDSADPADLANERDFDLHHPHDHFFRLMFGTAETASGCFLRVVPVDLRPLECSFWCQAFLTPKFRESRSLRYLECEAVFLGAAWQSMREKPGTVRPLPDSSILHGEKVWHEESPLDSA
jgi:hypothetical protein